MEIKYKWIFSLILSTNILINLDHGIIPAATGPIEASLKLTPDQLGYLGSLVYAGISLVGIFGGKLFIHFNAKGIIIISYIGMIVSLVMFPQNYGTSWPFYVSRFLTGCAQAPMMIYFPVWVDNFGGEVKTIWMTILQGVIPLGIFVGYVLSSIVSSLWKWHYAFYAQVVMLIPCAISFTFFVKSKDFAIRKSRRTKIENKSINPDELGSSMLSHSSKSYWSMMAELYSIKLWLCCTIVISILYFIVTGIQFWMTDYMIFEMHQDKTTVNIVFSCVSITAPVFGCIMGGLIAQKLGGYQRTKSLYVCVLYCAICCLSAAPVPFTDTFWFGAMCVWFLLFFGGAIVPPLMGIMLSSVPKHLKAFANSNTTMFQNLFGFLPAPSIYGFLMQKYGARVAVTVLMYYSFAGLLFMFLAVYFKKQELKSRSAETIINRTESQISVLYDEENFNITDRVLQYGDMPLQVSLAQHIDDQIPNYEYEGVDQEEQQQKENKIT